MTWLILCGNEENWDVAIKNKVWGIKPNSMRSWLKLLKGDIAFFYVTRAFKRVIGVSKVEEKLDPRTYPPKPLWPDEIREGKVIYPYRFNFEPIYIVKNPYQGISINGLRINKMKGMSRITDREAINELYQRAKLSWGVDISLPEGIVPTVPLEERKPLVTPVAKEAEIKPPEVAKLDDHVRRATEQIDKHPGMSELATVRILIEPLLEVLGWNVLNLDEVPRQYPIPGGKGTEYVDIALMVDNKPKVFVEAKRAEEHLEDYLAKQLINYAILGNVDWCVLTNGRELRVYNARWRVEGIEQKLLFKITIDEYRRKFDKLRLLSKERVAGGKLDDIGEQEYARRKVSEWLRQNEDTIIKGIVKLDPTLKEERVKATINEVLSFIRGMGDDCA